MKSFYYLFDVRLFFKVLISNAVHEGSTVWNTIDAMSNLVGCFNPTVVDLMTLGATACLEISALSSSMVDILLYSLDKLLGLGLTDGQNLP
jgi:hypothetical protein